MVIILIVRAGTVPSPPVNVAYYKSLYDPAVKFGAPTPDAGGRGKCERYDFPGTMEVTFQEIKAFPGTPTLNTAVLDGKTPSPEPQCVDIDQIVAAKVSRKCVVVHSIPGDQHCITSDGTVIPIGDTVSEYVTCSKRQCDGTLSLLGMSYYPQITSNTPFDTTRCLTAAGQQYSAALCDISNNDQLYRVTRFTPKGSPNDSGMYATITDRTTGKCIVVNESFAVVSGSCGISWMLMSPVVGTTQNAPQQIVYIAGINLVNLASTISKLTPDQLLEFMQISQLRSITYDSSNTVTTTPFVVIDNTTPTINPASSVIIGYTMFNAILFTNTPYYF